MYGGRLCCCVHACFETILYFLIRRYEFLRINQLTRKCKIMTSISKPIIMKPLCKGAIKQTKICRNNIRKVHILVHSNCTYSYIPIVPSSFPVPIKTSPSLHPVPSQTVRSLRPVPSQAVPSSHPVTSQTVPSSHPVTSHGTVHASCL